MSSNNLQYDAALGGNIKLPDTLSAAKFAAERFKEMTGLIESVANPENNKLIHQLLPNHIRRRAMTQNPKRLPRRYRQIHVSQMEKSGVPSKNRRPSRKYRRKARNLLREYARRMKRNVWLETHIWHAKRFHMRDLWGYRIPFTPCDRGYRAAYRAVAKHCMVQDVSYFGCVEVKGMWATLKAGFARITSDRCGLTITAKAFVEGKREGEVHLFEADSYPLKAIGRVSFMWKPERVEEKMTLWIWSHPLHYREVVGELKKVFELQEDGKEDIKVEEKNDRLNFITKNHSFVRNPRYLGPSGVEVKELKDTINRFRLTGPNSHACLHKALKPFHNLVAKDGWISEWTDIPANKESLKAQKDYWDQIADLSNPGEISPGLIMGLIVLDPRLNRAKKRTKAVPEARFPSNTFHLPATPRNLNQSPIWDPRIRSKILEEMLSTHEISARRSKEVLVPGEKAPFEDDLQPVPLLLVQRPGNESGFGSGWDLIVPAGYGLSVWINLVMCGARPAGVKESQDYFKEIARDEYLPDTPAFRKESERISADLKRKYFARPPNKRVNYSKLSIAFPFHCPWQRLVSEWGGNSDFYVLRDRHTLTHIDLALQRRCSIQHLDLPPSALVPLRLTMQTRGLPGDFALICLPRKDDLKENIRKIKLFDNRPVFTEPLRPDPNETRRLSLRTEHKKLLKRLRNRRVRAKRRAQETATQRVRIAKPETAALIRAQLERMTELWLPPNPASVRHQCSREVIGYLTTSNFALHAGQVHGVGYVTTQGLQQLLAKVSRGKLICLVRGTTSRNYRFADVATMK